MSPPPDLDGIGAALADRQVIVCVGSGGVGKTSVAASIALHFAMAGERVLVVTIDPARRLASSMGMETLGNSPSRIPSQRLQEAGLVCPGELSAMMLDVKRTSDEMILRHAPSHEQAQRILHNHFYQTASTVLAGSQEYMGMEKLYDLHLQGHFDRIVLDTPPTSNALDFIDAPNRLLDAFGNDAVRWIATPAVAAGKVGMKAMGFGSGYLVRQLSKLTGMETLQALADFLLSMRGMYEGFKERAAEVKALLASEDAAFVLVSAPDQMVVEEARFFYDVLQQNNITVRAVVANRMQVDWSALAGGLPNETQLRRFFPELEKGTLQTIGLCLEEQTKRARAEAKRVNALLRDLPGNPATLRLPSLVEDIHDLAGLSQIGGYLFGEGGHLPAELITGLAGHARHEMKGASGSAAVAGTAGSDP